MTLDRYLYAGGNPETLIDPDGHTMLNCRIPELCGMGGGPGASQAQIAKYLAQKRQEQHRLSSRYGERPGDDQRTATVQAAPQGTRDQGWDTLSTAQVKTIDTPLLQQIGRDQSNPVLNVLAFGTGFVAGIGKSVLSAGLCAANQQCLGGSLVALGGTALTGVASAVTDPAGSVAKLRQSAAQALDQFNSEVRNDPFQAGVNSGGIFTTVEGTGLAVAGGVEALTADAPEAAALARLPQDVAVDPSAPQALPFDRPISSSATQNLQLQQDIIGAQDQGATDIRVNQQQVNAAGARVGINRPDLQYTLDNLRYYIEYETQSLGAAIEHMPRIMANDPTGVFVPIYQP